MKIHILKVNLGEIGAFQDPPVMSFKRVQTIVSVLVKADFCPGKETVLCPVKKGTFPCYMCNCCCNVQKGEMFYHPRNGIPITISGHYSCKSMLMLYTIKCPCGMIYVGQTSHTGRDRIREHKSAMDGSACS
ncbi:hypothetical protein XELAEV_18001186mg [Xenopus laevis]|nr:hypothetical protein XELAEV_18001186mg [Xenopus laevis]